MAQGRAVVGLVQPRFTERLERPERGQPERQGDEVGEPGRGDRGQTGPGKGAGHERQALPHPDPSDGCLEGITGADLLEHGVVDDRIHRARLHREEHTEQQGGTDVGRHVGAQSTDQLAGQQGQAGEHQDASAAPSIGEDARGDLQERDDGGIGRRHDPDAAGVETDLAHEQLLDRHPQDHALEQGGDDERAQPPADAYRGLSAGVASSWTELSAGFTVVVMAVETTAVGRLIAGGAGSSPAPPARYAVAQEVQR